jgi:hypothetical protein
MKTKLLALLFALPMLVVAQDSLIRCRLGIRCSYGRTAISNESVFPAISISWSKHSIFAGPAVYYLSPEVPRPLTGAQMGYQFFPNGQSTRFSLFLSYDVNYLHGTVQEKYSNYTRYEWSEVNVSIEKTDITNYLGFGFKLKLFGQLSLNTNVGLGFLSVYEDKFTYRYDDGRVYESSGSLALRKIGFYKFFQTGLHLNVYSFKKQSKS